MRASDMSYNNPNYEMRLNQVDSEIGIYCFHRNISYREAIREFRNKTEDKDKLELIEELEHRLGLIECGLSHLIRSKRPK